MFTLLSLIFIILIIYLCEPLQYIHCPEIIYIPQMLIFPTWFCISFQQQYNHHQCVKKQLQKEFNTIHINTKDVIESLLLVHLSLSQTSFLCLCFNHLEFLCLLYIICLKVNFINVSG